MLLTLEGVIRRRVLLNFRVDDPSLIARLLPAPLEVLTHDGAAIVGVCLIGMGSLRPKGFPSVLGLSSENMAHRVAIRYPTANGIQDGVFIWRRETDQCVVSLLGGRLFPGVHQLANFTIEDSSDSLSIHVRTDDGRADCGFDASYTADWQPDSIFTSLADAAEFFRRGDCGFSCSLRGDRLDGLQLKTLRWQMSPLQVSRVYSTFFQDPARLPPDRVRFDSALLMRGIAHEWQEIADIPELAGAIAGQ